jgi:hypothetical protein
MIPRQSCWPRLLVVALVLLATPLSAQTSAAAGWHASPAAQLKSALRELAAAQRRHYADRGTYAASAGPLRLAPEPGVRWRLRRRPAPGGRRGPSTATVGLSCVIFVGQVTGLGRLPTATGRWRARTAFPSATGCMNPCPYPSGDRGGTDAGRAAARRRIHLAGRLVSI